MTFINKLTGGSSKLPSIPGISSTVKSVIGGENVLGKTKALVGVPEFLKKLRASKDKIAMACARGLVKGGLYLQRESQQLVPVQLGELKASAGTRNIGGQGFDADVVVFYGTDYAVPVHEDLVAQAPPARAAHGKFFNIKHAAEIAAAKGTPRGTAKGGMFKRGENQQAKFLEQPARELRTEILKIIAEEVRKVR